MSKLLRAPHAIDIGGGRSIEVSVHSAGLRFIKHVLPVFPGVLLDNLIVIPTFQAGYSVRRFRHLLTCPLPEIRA